MRRIFGLAIGALLFLRVFAQAQDTVDPFAQSPGGVSILLKGGKTIVATALRRAGENVMATQRVGNGTGEIGYCVCNVVKANFPEPPQMRAAKNLMANGRAEEALLKLDPILNYYAPFKDVPGSWWLQAARFKLDALVSQGRESGAWDLIGAMMNAASADPETLSAVRVHLAASWARKGEHERAMKVYDEVIQAGKNDDALALAWLNRGHSLLAQKEWEPALLAYLRLPVFYPDQKLLLPQALLGGMRAYGGIEDFADARKTFNELTAQFPSSPEAVAAKNELVKIEKKAPEKKEAAAP